MIVLVLFVVALLFVVGLLNRKDPPDLVPPEKKRRAYVLGVNYEGDNASDDEGCWKDVADYAEALSKSGVFEEHEVFKHVNNQAEGKHFTSKTGIQKLLSKIAARSHKEEVSLVYVHFCGRATPAGIETSDGDVIDTDWLIVCLTSFSPGTRVVATFDCAFDGALDKMEGRVVTFVSGESITHALLDVVQNSPWLLNDVSGLCAHVEDYIGARPVVSSTHDVLDDPCFLPPKGA
jgi:hypothetical protein